MRHRASFNDQKQCGSGHAGVTYKGIEGLYKEAPRFSMQLVFEENVIKFQPHFFPSFMSSLIKSTLLAISILCCGFLQAQSINFNYSGTVVTYTIPVTGIYEFTAAGAAGGASQNSGGLGAMMSGSFNLTNGTVLNIAIGGAGEDGFRYLIGGGGGGGGYYNPTLYQYNGGSGGSGIAIIRYPGNQRATGGTTVITSGGYTVHTFLSSGNFIT